MHFEWNTLPKTLEEMKQMPESALTSPECTAALTVAALCVYPENPDESIAMLDFLRGPRPLSNYDKQFLRDRFEGKPYLARSYFEGATPENNYTPNQPYTLIQVYNPHGKDLLDQGYLTLYFRSGGADAPRSIQLRNKPSTNQWFLWEQMLLAGIRVPKEEDPWA